MNLPQPGEIFENYKVLRMLGEGGMGQVFLAEDIRLDRKVALKFLSQPDGKKIDHKLIQRFENEAKILASLNHPNIVNIYTIGLYANIRYLAMEYIEGTTLTEVIEKQSFGVTDSIQVVQQVFTGLHQTHSKGILHRDIKPANLIATPDRQIKIVDFGISKSLMENDQDLTKENHFIGTINYMAPEIFKGLPPTPASDLFSVGVVFFELLTGKNPFKQVNKIDSIDLIRNHQLKLPEEVSKNIPLEVQNILVRLVAKDRSQRYQSALDALNDLEAASTKDIPEFLGLSIRPQITVNDKTMENFEVSDSETHLTDDNNQSPTKIEPQSQKIPFPLFNPKLSLKWSLFLVIITLTGFALKRFGQSLNSVGSPMELSNDTKDSDPAEFSFFSFLFNNGTTSGKGAERDLSSLDPGVRKALPPNTILKQSITKYNAVTGDYLVNQIQTIRIQKVSNDSLLAFVRLGETNQWDVQKISTNAFLPPLRSLVKGVETSKVTAAGRYDDLYPVQVGKEATFSFKTMHAGGAFSDSTKHCFVGGTEKIKIADQLEEVFLVSCKTTTDDTIETGKYFYSSKWNMIVKQEVAEESPRGKFIETTTLQSIKVPEN